jgi:TolB protein
MRRSVRATALLVALLAAGAAQAEDRPQIQITDPRGDKTYRAAIQRFATRGSRAEAAGATVDAAIKQGLEFSGLFSVLNERAFLEGTKSPFLDGAPAVNCPNWRQIDADALVQGEVETGPEGVRATFRLHDVARCQALVRGKRFTGRNEDAKRVGKAIADEIVGAFTGVRGVSDTELAFVSNRGGSKEIFVMDADGGNPRAATRNRSLSSFPDWDPTGNSVVYTSYRHRNRPALFLVARGPSSPGRILSGLNGGRPIYRGVFDPKGARLAIVMSTEGNTEIFTVERGGGSLRRLTRNRTIDVSPTWSPDGSKLAFVSDRTGAPQVYVMNADGSNQRRLTFQGSYNTAPAWSPDGRWIAYETQVGGQFDIWLIDPEGQTNVPLVTHARSDEHPTWAPDGRKLAFSSTRRGRADIYVTDLGGNADQALRITNAGENTNPAWGPYRR